MAQTIRLFVTCTAGAQWRSKVLRGPGSTVTWGPSRSPPLPLEVGPPIAARASGGALNLPQRVRVELGRQTLSGAFSAYLEAFFANIFMQFVVCFPEPEVQANRLIIFLHKIFVARRSGSPGARGPRFIEPPEPPVSTPLKETFIERMQMGIEKTVKLRNLNIFRHLHLFITRPRHLSIITAVDVLYIQLHRMIETNLLPVSIRESQSLPAFRRHLKTFYFQSAYPPSPAQLAQNIFVHMP